MASVELKQIGPIPALAANGVIVAVLVASK